eukprot:4236739-Amphidinium_carterae.1
MARGNNVGSEWLLQWHVVNGKVAREPYITSACRTAAFWNFTCASALQRSTKPIDATILNLMCWLSGWDSAAPPLLKADFHHYGIIHPSRSHC